MPGKTRKIPKDRKGPSESATLFPEGTIKRGLVVFQDGCMLILLS